MKKLTILMVMLLVMFAACPYVMAFGDGASGSTNDIDSGGATPAQLATVSTDGDLVAVAKCTEHGKCHCGTTCSGTCSVRARYCTTPASAVAEIFQPEIEPNG